MPQNATVIVTILNKLGLHARPAMVFVETATTFAAEISVRRKDQTEAVDGKSIMQMVMLAATQGTEIEISACGEDADSAAAALAGLVESKFDEE